MQQPNPPTRQSHAADGAAPPPLPVPDHCLLRQIGRGGFGEVWMARNVMGNFRAVKIVRRNFFAAAESYEKAYQGLKRFDPVSRTHEALVDVLHSGRDDTAGYFYYVMDLADDVRLGRSFEPACYQPRTLRSELRERGVLPLSESLQLAVKLAAAAGHLHQRNLVHRDIKPDNIIFVNGLPKLADVDLVGEAGGQSYVGTEGYTPPEGPGHVSGDIYALGIVLYEMITGKPCESFPEALEQAEGPFDWELWAELNHAALKAASRQPRERYASADEMAQALGEIGVGKSVRRAERRARWWKRVSIACATAIAAGLPAYIIREKISAEQTRTAAARAEAATLEAEVARTRFREAQAQDNALQNLILQQIVSTRLTTHAAGWSKEALKLAARAAQIRSTPNVLGQAAGALAGLDASKIWELGEWPSEFLAFTRDGPPRLLSGGPKGLHLISANGEPSLLTPSPIKAMAVALDGRVIYLAPGANGLEIRDSPPSAASPLPLQFPSTSENESSQPAGAWRFSARFTPDARYLAALTARGEASPRVRLWETAEGRQLFEKEAPNATAFDVSPDGGLVSVAQGSEGSHRLKVWEVPSGKIKLDAAASDSTIHSLRFWKKTLLARPNGAPAGWMLAAGDAGGLISLWDIDAPQVRGFLRGSHFEVLSLAVSPDHSLLASAGRETTRLWDIATGRLLLTLPTRDHVISLEFSPDGAQLAAACQGSNQHFPEISLWQLEEGRGIQTFRGLSHQITKVAISKDATRIAALAQNWELAVWDTGPGTLRWTRLLPGSPWSADNAALALDESGARVGFTAGQKAYVWDAATGEQLAARDLPLGLVDAGGFHPSGGFVALRVEWDQAGVPTLQLRNLLGENPLEPLAPIRAFNGGVYSINSPNQAEFFLVEGIHRTIESGTTNRSRSVAILDGLTGAPLWTNSKNLLGKPAFASLLVDSAGDWIGYQDLGQNGITLINWKQPHSPVLCFPSNLAAAAPHADLATQSNPLEFREHSFSLRRFFDQTLLHYVAIDQEHRFSPLFSFSGEYLAWGNADGAVSYCHIALTRRNLDALSTTNPPSPPQP